MAQKQTKHLLNTERIPTVEAHYHLVAKIMMGMMKMMMVMMRRRRIRRWKIMVAKIMMERRIRRWKRITQFGHL